YIAKLTVTGAGGCTSIKQRTIVIRGPQGSFTYNPLNGCKPLQVNFIASTLGRSSFIWDFNDGTTFSTTDSIVSHTYTVAGIYIPKMILMDAGGCVVPVTGPDTIHVHGITAAFTFTPATLCDKGTAQFNNLTTSNDIITGYQWDFGDGTFSTAQNPVHFYNTSGIYYPKLKAFSQNGCVDSTTATSPIRVIKSPVASLTRSGNGCTPLTVTFSGSISNQDTSAITWEWNFGNDQSSVLQNPPAQLFSTAKDYQVYVIATNSNGCKDTASSRITAFPIPAINAGADTTICKGIGTSLHVSGASTYLWSPVTGLSCIDCADPVALPDSLIKYTVKGTSIHGCINSDTIQVNVRLPFKMNITRADTICAGSAVQLNAAGASAYAWYPPNGLNNTTSGTVLASPRVTTLYRVIGTDDRNCFKDTGYIPVKVFPVPTVDAGQDRTINVGQMVDLIPAFSSDVTNVLWTPTGSIFRSSYPSITVKPKETTQYIVEVTNPGGCRRRDMVTIYVLCNGANVFIPNTFSPNGDGSNEVFYPRGSGLFRIKSARVFDRWGEIMYEKNDFNANDPNAGWDGTFKGRKLNTDVYIYTFEIICDNNSTLIYKGNIALVK
ncbi:MAG TPA: PKD domain-containing protein, partial [Ferruginibacter sp.]|nr:PKD domain-containing protein [Ferruginibacter sp.]